MKKATVIAGAVAAVMMAASNAFAQGFSGGYLGRAPGFFDSCVSSRASIYPEYEYYSPGRDNYYNSLAAIRREEARRIALENRQKSVETYFAVKEINREARAAARGPRPTAEDAIRYAREQVPDRLAPQQVDMQRGVIRWHWVFDEPAFTDAKDAIDELARQDLTGSRSAGASYAEARQRIAQMEAELKTRVKALPSSEYIAAKKFLIGLDLEFRSPRVSAALAAN